VGKKRRFWLVSAIVLALLITIAYTQLTIFVVQPIGAAPEGRTLIISRLNKTDFVDSADAMCARIQDGVSLLCRGAAIAAVAENAKIYMRLPYSRTLYLISTGGKTYESRRSADKPQ
jgi:hypothetical protein